MIRINLLGRTHEPARRGLPINATHGVTAVCVGVLLVGLAVAGWRYWQLRNESAALDRELIAARSETARLHGVIAQVQQFEQRRAQLQQRVALIEQLRRDQTGPVHMLDQISLALPSTIWLDQLRQTAATNEVVIGGRSLSLTGLSDFVANLEHSGYFRRSVEIVSSTTEPGEGPQGEVVRFEIKALFTDPTQPTAAAQASAGGPVKPGS